jgi:hypothetical protein
MSQCIGVGWPPSRWRLRDPSIPKRFAVVRNHLDAMRPGDFVVVHLRGHCVGRVGQIVRLRVEDHEWEPLVPKGGDYPGGEVGRRVEVRWDLNAGPADPDLVVKLPPRARLRGKYMGTMHRLTRKEFERVAREMADPSNWVPVGSRFAHETALSDYIATFPHHLEDGFEPHPSKKVREMRFEDGGRADVILQDRDARAVVVECKQGDPTTAHVQQVLRYQRQLRRRTGDSVRAILVHGGATKLPKELRRWRGRVEFVQYRLSVGFAACR